MFGEVMSCSYCLRYGVNATPPWKNTSIFGHTSSRCFLPVISIMHDSTDIIHDGTPLILVTFLFIASRAMRSRFISKSLISAVCFFGTRTRFTSGLMFSISMALRSPTSEPGRL